MRTSLHGRGQLIRSYCGVLFLFLVAAHAGSFRSADPQGHPDGGPPDTPVFTREQIGHAIALSAGYMERSCGPDGKFVYEVDLNSGRQAASYNIVRHAGAIYALAIL